MMRRTYGLAVAAALVLAIGSITVAFASSSSRGSADHRVQVIRLVAKGVQETNVDLGKKGFSQGDQELVALNLFRDGKKIGEAGNLCQFVRVTKASATDLCQVDMSLPAGQITSSAGWSGARRRGRGRSSWRLPGARVPTRRPMAR
jgi:hypothetical protein